MGCEAVDENRRWSEEAEDNIKQIYNKQNITFFFLNIAISIKTSCLVPV